MKRKMKEVKQATAPKSGSSGLIKVIDPGDGVNTISPIARWTVPATWTWTFVGEVGEVQAGIARTPLNRPSLSPVKYLRTANITDDGLDLEDLHELEIDEEELEVFALRADDIVLTESSGSPEHVGKAALWRGEVPVCCFQNHVLRFRTMGVLCDFALILFQHYSKNGLLASLLRGIGINHLGVENFSRLPFPLPPPMEQKRIAAEFRAQSERIREALDSLQSAKKKLVPQRQAVLRREFGVPVDGLSAGSTLPDGWSRIKVGAICNAVNGRAFKTSEWSDAGIPIVRIQNLRDKEAEFNYFAGEVEDKHLIDTGDLLFAWSGTPGTSFGAFIWNGPQAALNQHIFKLIPDRNQVLGEYLYHALNLNLSSYVASAQGGSGLAHLKRSQFLESEIVLAPLSDQKRIVQAINDNQEAVLRQEELIDRSIQHTRTLHQSILLMAVEGRLVEQDASDSSSQEHLVEIRATFARHQQQVKDAKRVRRDAARARKTVGRVESKRALHDVLIEFGPLSVHELFIRAGYREDLSDDVDNFYRVLDAAMKSKKVARKDGDDPETTMLVAGEEEVTP